MENSLFLFPRGADLLLLPVTSAHTYLLKMLLCILAHAPLIFQTFAVRVSAIADAFSRFHSRAIFIFLIPTDLMLYFTKGMVQLLEDVSAV